MAYTAIFWGFGLLAVLFLKQTGYWPARPLAQFGLGLLIGYPAHRIANTAFDRTFERFYHRKA